VSAAIVAWYAGSVLAYVVGYLMLTFFGDGRWRWLALHGRADKAAEMIEKFLHVLVEPQELVEAAGDEPVVSGSLLELFPTHIRATAVGLATSVSRIGAALGAYLLPWSLDHLGRLRRLRRPRPARVIELSGSIGYRLATAGGVVLEPHTESGGSDDEHGDPLDAPSAQRQACCRVYGISGGGFGRRAAIGLGPRCRRRVRDRFRGRPRDHRGGYRGAGAGRARSGSGGVARAGAGPISDADLAGDHRMPGPCAGADAAAVRYRGAALGYRGD
jgi:hypothetical protein